MKKFVIRLFIAAFVIAYCGAAYAGTGPHGPAPNSGDGVPDGSGFEGHYGSGK